MNFDSTTLILSASVSVLLALLAAVNIAVYGLFLMAGWETPAVLAHRSAERLAVAAVAVALAGYIGALTMA